MIRRCGSQFRIEADGKAFGVDCDSVTNAERTKALERAKESAMRKASKQCPSKCPTVFVRPMTSTIECKNGTLIVHFAGIFQCKPLVVPKDLKMLKELKSSRK